MIDGPAEKPTLADLIDFELQFERDENADQSYLRRRDAEIGQAIGADRLEGRRLYLAWLAAIRQRDNRSGESAGTRTEHFLEVVAVLLFVLGLIAGGSAVVPWLAYATKRPVNVIFFWCSLIGVQLLLLTFWCMAIMPRRWLERIPGISSLHLFLRAVGRLPPVALTWIGSWFSPGLRQLIATVRGQARRLEWLYGKLLVWNLVRLTQVFAVAFNCGAIATIVALSYGHDPTFGWRSTMLDEAELHQAVRVIAAPWSALEPGAVPTLEEIRRTKYSSWDERFDGWPKKAWWPFVFASMVVYGLAPRMLTWSIAFWQVRRAVGGARLDRHEFQKLQSRLRRPFVDTRGEPDVGDADDDGSTTAALASRGDLDFDGKSLAVLKWSGVHLDRAEIEAILRSRFGAEVAALLPVGQLDQSRDDEALRQIATRDEQQPIALVLEAWEPPVADYLDFVRRLRSAVGDGVLIAVLLYHRDPSGAAIPPDSRDVEIWRGSLAALGDPWLAAEPLLEEAEVAVGGSGDPPTTVEPGDLPTRRSGDAPTSQDEDGGGATSREDA